MKDYDKKFNKNTIEEWHKHYTCYPEKIIHDCRSAFDADKRILQNRVRDAYLMLEELPAEYFSEIGVKCFEDFGVYPSISSEKNYEFEVDDVQVKLLHCHGVEYKNGFDSFLGINPICYSWYNAVFCYKGKPVKMTVEEKWKTVERMKGILESKINALNDKVDGKAREFVEKFGKGC